MIDVKDKIKFLKWILTHSIFTRREAYWLLSYLKDHVTILRQTVIVADASNTPRGLVFQQGSDPDDCFYMVKDGLVLNQHEKIFYDIRMYPKETLYVSFKFNGKQPDDTFLDVLEKNPFDCENTKKIIIPKNETLLESAKTITGKTSEHTLLTQIDKALDCEDFAAFSKLTKQLKKEKKKEKS